MRLTKTSSSALATAGAVALLVLAGCSNDAAGNGAEGGEPTEPQGAVFDFTQVNGIPAAKQITIEIPSKLVEADPEYSESRVVASVTAKAHKLDSAEFCAVDFTYTYADGALDRVLNSRWYDRHAGEPTDPEPQDKVAFAISPPGGPMSFEEIDPTSPDFGETTDSISEDFKTITSVVECAAGPTDIEGNADVFFNQTVATEQYPDTFDIDDFAEVEVSVMKNGDLNIPEHTLDDWMLDANGEWIPSD